MSDPQPVDDAVDAAALGRATRRGIAWTAIGQIVTNAIRIGAVAALGRLLSSRDFGVVMGAMVLLTFAGTLRDLGVGMALVQHRAPTRAHVRTAFAVSLWLAIAVGGVLVVAAAPLARLLGDEGGADIIRALAGLAVLRGLRTVPTQLATRAMRFRLLAMVDVVGYVSGIALTLALAAAGWGPWALVWGYLLETALGTGILLVLVRTPMAITVERAALRDLLHFGAGQTLSSLANTVATQGDYVVVSSQLGTGALGFYGRAYELINYPSTLFNNIAGGVLFAALARLQDDRARLAEALELTLFVIAAMLLPASAGLILVAPEAIRVLMGPGWDAAVVPFQIMSVAMLLRTSYKVGATVARARGDVYRISIIQLIYAVNVIGGALVASRWGIDAVAITTTAAVALHFGLLTWLGARHAGIGAMPLVRAHVAAMVGTVATMLVAVPVVLLLRRAGVGAPGVLAAGTVGGGLGFAAFVVWQLRRKGSRWARAWRDVRGLRRGGGGKGKGGKRARRQAAEAAAANHSGPAA